MRFNDEADTIELPLLREEPMVNIDGVVEDCRRFASLREVVTLLAELVLGNTVRLALSGRFIGDLHLPVLCTSISPRQHDGRSQEAQIFVFNHDTCPPRLLPGIHNII